MCSRGARSGVLERPRGPCGGSHRRDLSSGLPTPSFCCQPSAHSSRTEDARQAERAKTEHPQLPHVGRSGHVHCKVIAKRCHLVRQFRVSLPDRLTPGVAQSSETAVAAIVSENCLSHSTLRTGGVLDARPIWPRSRSNQPRNARTCRAAPQVGNAAFRLSLRPATPTLSPSLLPSSASSTTPSFLLPPPRPPSLRLLRPLLLTPLQLQYTMGISGGTFPWGLGSGALGEVVVDGFSGEFGFADAGLVGGCPEALAEFARES